LSYTILVQVQLQIYVPSPSTFTDDRYQRSVHGLVRASLVDQKKTQIYLTSEKRALRVIKNPGV
jgi:hypothetical protein